jgi:hypothetical protein
MEPKSRHSSLRMRIDRMRTAFGPRWSRTKLLVGAIVLLIAAAGLLIAF